MGKFIRIRVTIMDRPKLLIIAPAWKQGWWGGGKVLAPPLVLPLLAGLTPPEIEVRLIDENVESVDLQADVDWVAITCMTASAPRAYAIAQAFRERGIPVVMGGIHPTVLPDEAAIHADAVVIGEAEPIWQDVLGDLKANQLKSRYEHEGFAELGGFPFPRRELLRKDRYLTINVVQTARGCPNGCSFCSVSSIFGRPFRFRPIEEVIEEIRSLEGGWIGFVDDNIAGQARRAKELFEALIHLKKKRRWVGQTDISIADNPELMKLAVKSGCQAMFIGLESVSEENLHATHKLPNLHLDMGKAIRKIHKAGIEIIGSFVLGLDNDNIDTFKKTLKFAERHKLAAAQFSVLTPYPGTEMRKQLECEGRIANDGWEDYTMSKVVFQPLNMTKEDLKKGQRYIYKRFYSILSILKRSLTWRSLRLRNLIEKLLVNISYRSIGSKSITRRLTWGLPTKK